MPDGLAPRRRRGHARSYDRLVKVGTQPGEPHRRVETAGGPAVDPATLGIREFSTYALVIDARTAHEYREDHIPGAINLPVVDDAEFAEVGIAHGRDPHAAYLIGAEYVARNLATHIRDHISKCRPGDRILVYCFRGGKRSRAWVDTLRAYRLRNRCHRRRLEALSQLGAPRSGLAGTTFRLSGAIGHDRLRQDPLAARS